MLMIPKSGIWQQTRKMNSVIAVHSIFSHELESLGGEALLVLNQELRYHFMADYAAVVFFDVGNVWAERSSFGEDLRTALGFGGRANTPVGLVRFDIAWPLDRREEDNSVQLYLGLGNTF